MFSGLSKEINNWFPNKKREDLILGEKETKPESEPKVENKDNEKTEKPSETVTEDAKEEVNDVIKSTATTPSTEDKPKLASFEMLGNVKSQVSSWFGSATASLPNIPGLKRSEIQNVATSPNVTTPNEDVQEGDQANVGTKAIEGAKNIGNLLYSAVNKAGQSVTEVGTKIKKSVEDNTILGDFNKEQESFIKENSSRNDIIALPPWVGHPNEDQLKEQCLNLSKDKKNFIRNPPPGVEFDFNYNLQYPIALETLKHDKLLNEMRFQLVPKTLNEETFWRNYFYRISLITQTNELQCLQEDNETNNSKTIDENVDKENINNVESNDKNIGEPESSHGDDGDFISDDFNTNSSQELDEIRKEMKKLGIETSAVDGISNEQDWEKELDEEIQEFELVQNEK